MPEIPAFLKYQFTNGRVHEDHAPKSVIFRACSSDLCNGEKREFQIASIDAASGISVFRCVICDDRIKVNQSSPSAPAENKNNRSKS